MVNRNIMNMIKKVPAAIQRLLFYRVCKKNCCFWLSCELPVFLMSR